MRRGRLKTLPSSRVPARGGGVVISFVQLSRLHEIATSSAAGGLLAMTTSPERSLSFPHQTKRKGQYGYRDSRVYDLVVAGHENQAVISQISISYLEIGKKGRA